MISENILDSAVPLSLATHLPLDLKLDNTRGSVFMVLAMAAFAVEDMLIKAASSTAPIGLILAIFGFGGMLVFVHLTRKRGEKILHPEMWAGAVLIRALCEAIARLGYVLAITLSTLSSASAIIQATPIIAILGAAFLFDEHVGPKRWMAIIVGFVGVLMIVRPGLEGFEAASLFAVIATFGFAGRDLATRAAPKVLSNVQLGIYGFFILIPTGIAMLLFSGDSIQLDLRAGSLIFGAIVFGVIAYNALTIAMRTGDVSVVTPFRYSRLLFALILGVLVFNEKPDALSLVGSLLIVLSGGYALLQNRKKVPAS